MTPSHPAPDRRTPRPLLALACALVAAAQLGGCGGAPKSGETLMDSVRGYNDGLRWQRYPVAASAIPPKERDTFLDERAEIEDDLRISDYEIARVSLDDGQDKAVVRIRYTWFLDSKGAVHETTTEQLWERHGKRWFLVEESHIRGEPMPGVPDPKDDALAEPAATDPLDAPGDVPGADALVDDGATDAGGRPRAAARP